jgi:hypothetical protein
MKLVSEQLDEAGEVTARFYRGRPKTMTPEERANDFFSLPPLARTKAALARVIRQAEQAARESK